MADETWREFYDTRRSRHQFHQRMNSLGSTDLKLVGEVDGVDQWQLGDDTFGLDGMRGAREIVAAYAVYRRRTLEDGGTPDEFERPTKEGW